MKALVACEFSGVVRDALIARGIDAVSCDLLPSEKPGPHIQGDVRDLLGQPWGLVIAHPPCTYLANSGVRWLYNADGCVNMARWEAMLDAGDFFLACLSANAPLVAVENPVMHGHANFRKPDFTVQPWQFGDNFKKRTCFWTKGLPPLAPTSNLDGSTADAACHKAPPSKDRWKDRSRTYPGLAKAIADQWGGLLLEAAA